MATPARDYVLLGSRCLPRVANVAEDDGCLQGTIAVAGDDGLG
jgi:hypothetical protein